MRSADLQHVEMRERDGETDKAGNKTPEKLDDTDYSPNCRDASG